MKRYIKSASSKLRTTNGEDLPYEIYWGYSGFKKLNIPDNNYVLDIRYFNQYAEGVTGQTNWRKIYTTPQGFKTKSEAREFMKLIDLKPYSKKGRYTPYGNIGAKSLSVTIIPAGQVEDGAYYSIEQVYLFTTYEDTIQPNLNN